MTRISYLRHAALPLLLFILTAFAAADAAAQSPWTGTYQGSPCLSNSVSGKQCIGFARFYVLPNGRLYNDSQVFLGTVDTAGTISFSNITEYPFYSSGTLSGEPPVLNMTSTPQQTGQVSTTYSVENMARVLPYSLIGDGQPTAVEVTASGGTVEGFAVELAATATGGLGPYTYAWTKNGAPAGTSEALSFDPLGPGDAGDYVVTISNGGADVTSQPYTLVVRDPSTVYWTQVGPAATADVIGAGSGNEVFAQFGGDNPGIYRSTDNGVGWTRVAASGADVLASRALTRTGSGRIVSGNDTASFNNGVGKPVFYSDNGAAWTEASTFSPGFVAPGGTAGFIDFVTHNDGQLYAADLLSSGVWRSTDNGSSWTAASDGIPTYFGSAKKCNGITSQSGSLIAATDINGFYRSVDNGANWTQAMNGASGNQGKYLVAAPDGSAAFGIIGSILYRTTDGAASWSRIGEALTAAGYGTIVGVATGNGNNVYAYTNLGRIFESGDLGDSWIEVDTLDLPDESLSGFEIRFYVSNGIMYVANASGMFRSDLSQNVRVPLAPTITTSGGTVNTNDGRPFSLTIQDPLGTAPVTWTWTKDGAPYTNDAPTLAFTTITPADGGNYVATATNSVGTDSVSFTLNVSPSTPGASNFGFTELEPKDGFFAGRFTKILALPDGNLWVGGDFTEVNGTAANQSVVVTPEGAIASSYDSSASFPTSAILAAARQPNGKLLVGYDGFVINTVPGNPFNDDYFTRINADGTWDPSFRSMEGSAQLIGGGAEVLAIGVAPNGDLFIGGDAVLQFNPATAGILHFDSEGNFIKVIPFSGDVFQIHVNDDGTMFVGGDFTNYGGDSQADNFVKITSNGNLAPGFSYGVLGSNDEVLAMAVQPDGKIIVAGDRFIRRIQSNGDADTEFNTNVSSPSDDVNVIRLQENGKILVAGEFTFYSASQYRRIFRLEEDGTLDSSFVPPNNLLEIVDLAVHPSGDVFAVGYTFGSADVYRLFGDPVDFVITQSPVDTAVNLGDDATLEVLVYTTGSVSYQWRKNGVTIPGADQPTYTIADAEKNDAGTYDVVVSYDGVDTPSEAAELTVLAEPVFVEEPSHAFLLSGGSVTLSARATGATPLEYQWLKDGGELAGETGPRLTVNDDATTGAGTYTVRVSNSLDNATSIPAIVEIVDDPLAINSAFDLGTGLARTRFGSPVTPSVDVIQASSDGGFYVAGAFSELNDVPFAQERGTEGISKITADGTIDPNFHFFDSGDFYDLAIHIDGDLLALNSQSSVIRKYNAMAVRDTAFETAQGSGGGTLTTMTVLPGGGIIAAGNSLSSFNGQAANRMVLLDRDGVRDLSFSPEGFGSVTILGILPLPEGKFLVYGGLSQITGTDQRHAIRLNPDGSFDDSFKLIDSPPSSSVNAAVVMDDGSILIGGNFGSPRQYLARLNADGSLHEKQPDEPATTVQTLTKLKDGSVIVKGNFGTISGVLHVIDSDCNFIVDGYAASNVATMFEVLPDGRVVIAGPFTQWDGQDSSDYVAVLNGFPARLSFDRQPIGKQTVDPGEDVEISVAVAGAGVSIQWQKNGDDIPGENSATLTLAGVDKDDTASYRAKISNSYGTIYSQESTLIVRDAPIILEQPQAASVLAKFEAVSFSVVAEGLAPLEYEWFVDGNPILNSDTPTLSFDSVRFDQAGDYTVVVSNGKGSITSDPVTLTVNTPPPGTVDTTFRPGLNFQVNDILLQGQKYVIGGLFTQVKDDTGASVSRNRLARLNRDGSLDPSFEATVNFSSSYVSGIRQFSNGDLLIFGKFTQIIDNSGTESISHAARVTADGKIVRSWNVGLNNVVTGGDIASDDSVVLVGTFSTPRSRIVRLDANGQVDTTFDPQPNVSPSTVAIDSLDRIVIGGPFTAIAGSNQQYVARLSSDGSLDTSFDTPVIDSTGSGDSILEVYIDDQDGVYLSGNINRLDGATTFTTPIRLNSDGSWDSSFSSSQQSGNGAMTLQQNGKLLAGNSNGGLPTVFRHDANGSVDSTFIIGSGPDAYVHDIQLERDGSILFAGSFGSWDGDNNVAYLARVVGDVPPIEFAVLPERVVVPIGDPIEVIVDAVGTSTISYSWTKNDDPPLDLGIAGPSLSIASALLTDSGSYTVTITNDSGSKSAMFDVIVYDAPVILDTPSSVSTPEGSSVTLSVEAVGTGDLSYQWQRNGIDVTGATSSTLVIDPITVADAGNYTVIVTGDVAPPATSDAAAVSVFRIPSDYDTSFNFNPGTNFGTIGTMMRAGHDGSVYVTSMSSNLRFQKYGPDGTRDDTFTTIVAPHVFSTATTPTDLDFMLDGRLVVNKAQYDDGTGTTIIAPAVFSTSGAWDSSFNVGFNLTNVLDVLPMPDGSVWACGHDMTFSGAKLRGIFRLKADGSPDFGFSSGPGFEYRASPAGVGVRTMLLLADGRVAVGGHFDHYNGVPVDNLCILHPDGQLDESFQGPSFDSRIRALAEFPDGRLVAVGQFQNVGGQTRQYAAIINPDGSLDTAFDPGNSLFNNSHHPHRVAITRTGEIVIAGNATFSTDFSSGTARFHILDQSGAPASTWPTTFTPNPAASNNRGIGDLFIHAGGRLHVAGNFYAFNNVGSAANGQGFARFNGYQVDPAFVRQPYPQVVALGDPLTLSVRTFSEFGNVDVQWYKDGVAIPGATDPDLAIASADADDADDYYCVATNSNNQTTPSRTVALRVVSTPEFDFLPSRVSPVIGAEAHIRPRVVGGGTLTYEWLDADDNVVSTDRDLTFNPTGPSDAGVYRLRVTSDLHGSATSEPVFVTPIATPGAKDEGFTTGINDRGPDGFVYDVLLLPDDSALVGGSFISYDGNTSAARLAKVNVDGSLNTDFLDNSSLSTGTVRVILELPSAARSTSRYLVAGENFSSYNGVNVANAFVVDGSGALDTNFTPTVGFQVFAATVQTVNNEQKIVLAGSSSSLLRLDAVTGDTDASLNVGATGFTYSSGTMRIQEILTLPDQRLAVCGWFSKLNDDNTFGFVILNANGSVSTTSSAMPFNARPASMILLDDNHLLVGGSTSSHPLLKINVNDGTRAAFTQPSVGAQIFALRQDASGKILVGGDFNDFAAGNVPTDQLIRLLSDGSTDYSFQPLPPNEDVYDIEIDSIGRIWVAGAFTAAQNRLVDGLVRYLGDGGPLEILESPQDLTIDEGSTATLGTVAVGPGPISYQWYAGTKGDTSAPIAGATGEVFTTPELAGTARYWVRVTDDGSGQFVDTETVTVAVITKPVITVDPTEVTVEFGDATVDVFAGVTAVDYLLRDVTVNLTNDVALDVNTLGDQTITYSVTDGDGREPTPPLPTRLYHVVDTTPPNLTIDPDEITVPVGLGVDPLAGVSATDLADAEVTILASPSSVDTSSAGDVVVTYTATDDSGNETELTRTYHVVVDTGRPLITVDPPVVIINEGDPLTPGILDGITAADDVDGDVTAGISLSGDTPDRHTPGIYRVRYRVTDFSGNRSAFAYRTYRVEVAITVDSDGDGLDDDWEREHFAVGNGLDSEDLRYNGSDDADGDGTLNEDEFKFNTDPRAYEISFRKGWNLVSLTHLPPDRDISKVFSDGNGGTVYAGTPWIWNADTSVLEEATEVYSMRPVWLYATEAATVTIRLYATPAN